MALVLPILLSFIFTNAHLPTSHCYGFIHRETHLFSKSFSTISHHVLTEIILLPRLSYLEPAASLLTPPSNVRRRRALPFTQPHCSVGFKHTCNSLPPLPPTNSTPNHALQVILCVHVVDICGSVCE